METANEKKKSLTRRFYLHLLLISCVLLFPAYVIAVCTADATAGGEVLPILEGSSGGHNYVYTANTDMDFPPNANGVKDIVLPVAVAGMYKISVSVYGPTGNNNSWFVEVVGLTDMEGTGIDIFDVKNPSAVWQDQYINARGSLPMETGPERVWFLTNGSHVVRFYGREANTYLECIGIDVQPTYTVSPTPSITETSTPTVTPSVTETVTETFTSSPTSTTTFTETFSLTTTISATFTVTSTTTPTATPTNSGTVTQSFTPTITQTFTNSPTWTPTVTPTNTPDKISVVRVYTENGDLVRELGSRYSYSFSSGLSLNQEPFEPEKNGVLAVTDGINAQWEWYGADQNGQPMPNGLYLLEMEQSGGLTYEKGVWLVRADADLGQVLVYPNPVKKAPVWIRVVLTGAQEAEAKIYNTAGEQVGEMNFGIGNSIQGWNLKTTGGVKIASGLYLLQVRFIQADGVRETEIFKFAVIR